MAGQSNPESVALTPEYCNSQYNMRQRINGVPELIQNWTDQSRDLRSQHKANYDLAYGDGAAERLDLFPASTKGASLFVFIHGGYWRTLDKSDFTFVAPALVAAGISVAIVNYALAPAVTIDAIVMQNVRAIAWLYRNAAKYGYDRNKIHVGGHSAGGHLTAMMMCARWPVYSAGLPADLIKGGLVMSGLYDLEPIRLADFLNVDLRLTPASAAKMSPAYMTPATSAPVLSTVGGDESDEFKRQNSLIAKHWRKSFAGDVAMPGLNHFTICDELTKTDSPLFKALVGLCKGA